MATVTITGRAIWTSVSSRSGVQFVRAETGDTAPQLPAEWFSEWYTNIGGGGSQPLNLFFVEAVSRVRLNIGVDSFSVPGDVQGPDLNAEVRAGLKITLEVGGTSASITGTGGDTEEPYYWSIDPDGPFYARAIAAVDQNFTLTLQYPPPAEIELAPTLTGTLSGSFSPSIRRDSRNHDITPSLTGTLTGTFAPTITHTPAAPAGTSISWTGNPIRFQGGALFISGENGVVFPLEWMADSSATVAHRTIGWFEAQSGGSIVLAMGSSTLGFLDAPQEELSPAVEAGLVITIEYGGVSASTTGIGGNRNEPYQWDIPSTSEFATLVGQIETGSGEVTVTFFFGPIEEPDNTDLAPDWSATLTASFSPTISHASRLPTTYTLGPTWTADITASFLPSITFGRSNKNTNLFSTLTAILTASFTPIIRRVPRSDVNYTLAPSWTAGLTARFLPSIQRDSRNHTLSPSWTATLAATLTASIRHYSAANIPLPVNFTSTLVGEFRPVLAHRSKTGPTYSGHINSSQTEWVIVLRNPSPAFTLPAHWFPASLTAARRALRQIALTKTDGQFQLRIGADLADTGQDFLPAVEQGICIRIWKHSAPNNILVIRGLGDATEPYGWAAGSEVAAFARTLSTADAFTVAFEYDNNEYIYTDWGAELTAVFEPSISRTARTLRHHTLEPFWISTISAQFSPSINHIPRTKTHHTLVPVWLSTISASFSPAIRHTDRTLRNYALVPALQATLIASFSPTIRRIPRVPQNYDIDPAWTSLLTANFNPSITRTARPLNHHTLVPSWTATLAASFSPSIRRLTRIPIPYTLAPVWLASLVAGFSPVVTRTERVKQHYTLAPSWLATLAASFAPTLGRSRDPVDITLSPTWQGTLVANFSTFIVRTPISSLIGNTAGTVGNPAYGLRGSVIDFLKKSIYSDMFRVYDNAGNFLFTGKAAGANSLRLIDGSFHTRVPTYSYANVYGVNTGIHNFDIPLINIDQYRDELILTHPSYTVLKIYRTFEEGDASEQFWPVQFSPQGEETISGKAAAIEARSTTYDDNEGGLSWTVAAIYDNGREMILAENDINTVASADIGTHVIRLSWDQVPDAQFYRVYGTSWRPKTTAKDAETKNEAMGLLGEVNNLDLNPHLVYDLITPDFSRQPLRLNPVFNKPNNFPSASALFSQRRIYASTYDHPARLFASAPGRQEDYSRSDRDDASFILDLDSKQSDRIHSIVDAQFGVFFLSERGIWLVRSSDGSGITARNAVSKQEQGAGARSRLHPLSILNSVLYISNLDNTPRALTPVNTTPNQYTTTDIALYSSHLFRDQHPTLGIRINHPLNYYDQRYSIVHRAAARQALYDPFELISWTYAGRPDRILWAVREDGVLLSCVYAPEQQVNAWSRHSTRGRFRLVQSVYEKGSDTVYFLVERGGRLMIESLGPFDANYIDTAIPFDASIRSRPIIPPPYVRLIIKQYINGRVQTERSSLSVVDDVNFINYTGLVASITTTQGDTEAANGPFAQAKGGDIIRTAGGYYRITNIRSQTTAEITALREVPPTDTSYFVQGLENVRHPIDRWEIETTNEALNAIHLRNQVINTIEGRSLVRDRILGTGTTVPGAFALSRGMLAGIPFSSYFTTLPVSVQGNVIESKPQNITEVGLRCINSASMLAGTEDELYPVIFDDAGREATELQSGIFNLAAGSDWTPDVALRVESDLPFKILGIVLRFEYGDRVNERSRLRPYAGMQI